MNTNNELDSLTIDNVVPVPAKDKIIFAEHRLGHAQYYAELRSGRIIKADEGFMKLFGYTKEDIAAGMLCMDIMRDVDTKEFVAELRNQFVYSNKACYYHNVVSKDGREFTVCAFVELQNTLLKGHRVVVVDIADISAIVKEGVH